MPTTNSYMDKLFAANPTKKMFATIDLQRQREVKRSQVAPQEFTDKPPECDWRLALKSEQPKLEAPRLAPVSPPLEQFQPAYNGPKTRTNKG